MGKWRREMRCERGEGFAHTYTAEGVQLFTASCAINQCLGQPGQKHFQTHLLGIMPAIPPSPRDSRASLMNQGPLRRRCLEGISPFCNHGLLLTLLLVGL